MTWEGVRQLNEHPERAHWSPGGGGLGLHSIDIDAVDPRSMMIGISAAGVYASSDGGVTWASANKGSKPVLPAAGETSDLGRCVHHLVAHPVVGGARFQQNHVGVYFNAGTGWRNVTKGLPGDYGFASAIHPHDPETAYVFPLEFPMRMNGAAGEGPSTRWPLRGDARGPRDRPLRSGRGVLRNDEWRAVGKRRCRAELDAHRRASPADPLGGDRDRVAAVG